MFLVVPYQYNVVAEDIKLPVGTTLSGIVYNPINNNISVANSNSALFT